MSRPIRLPWLAPALGALMGSPPATAAECDVAVTVIDADDQPVVGLDVQLADGAAPRHATTDAEGRARFPAVPGPTEVVAMLGEGGPSPRFTILDNGTPVGLRAAVDPAVECAVTLGPDSDHPLAPDLLALYQGLRRGFALMQSLEIRPTNPLRVEVNDAIASPTEAYWSGTSSFHPEDVRPARLVLGTQATRRRDPGAPDNREYHELGHHALATAFGALPRARDDAPQDDYHHNPSSTHAFTEGFAIFYAAMVARQIEGRPDAGRYRVEGAWLDLELDYRPWDLRGTESVAVASLLWDLVDGDREALEADLRVVEPHVRTDAGIPHLLVGQVLNESDALVTEARVQVRGPGVTLTAPVGPRLLPAGGTGWFALPVPAPVATSAADDQLAGLELHATPIPAATDDDPVQVELVDLWAAIAEFRSDRPGSNGRLWDVSDLYRALRGRFGGQDADADGHEDIDQLFVAHGLYADLNGNRAHEPAEAIGPTSHPGRSIEVDGSPEVWPDLIPRNRLVLPAALRVQATVTPADSVLLVLVSGSSWGGYLAPIDADGQLRVIPPPAREGAHIWVVAVGMDVEPSVVWHRDASDLLAELETHRSPYLAIEAELDPRAGGSTRAGAPGWQRLAFGGGALVALVGLLLIAVGWPRSR
ncbi:MAG: carboxypeptidase-like regulatory domain-containing protein [Myxococcota bacterium]